MARGANINTCSTRDTNHRGFTPVAPAPPHPQLARMSLARRITDHPRRRGTGVVTLLWFLAAQRDKGKGVSPWGYLDSCRSFPAGLVAKPLVAMRPGTAAPARPLCTDPKELCSLVCSFIFWSGGSSSIRLVGTPSLILASDMIVGMGYTRDLAPASQNWHTRSPGPNTIKNERRIRATS